MRASSLITSWTSQAFGVLWESYQSGAAKYGTALGDAGEVGQESTAIKQVCAIGTEIESIKLTQ
jgi:hypothetical protein